MKSKKTKAVEDAEFVYQEIQLECLEIEKDLEELYPTKRNNYTRKYVVPYQVYYRFAYTWNGKRREIEIVRKNGNPRPLTTNIRVEIVKQLAKELKEIEGIIITKGGKA